MTNGECLARDPSVGSECSVGGCALSLVDVMAHYTACGDWGIREKIESRAPDHCGLRDTHEKAEQRQEGLPQLPPDLTEQLALPPAPENPQL